MKALYHPNPAEHSAAHAPALPHLSSRKIAASMDQTSPTKRRRRRYRGLNSTMRIILTLGH